MVEGRLHPGRLAEAVAAASEACPGARPVWEEQAWVDGGASPPVVVVDASEHGANDLPRLPEPQAPLGGPSRPLCQVVLIKRDSRCERSTMAFRSHDAAMDAKGMLTWADDMFLALCGEDRLGAPDPGADRDVNEPLMSERNDYCLSDKLQTVKAPSRRSGQSYGNFG